MGGLWGALTWQGKSLVVGVVLLVLLILGLTTRHGSGSGDSASSAPGQPANGVTAPVQTAIAGAQISGVAAPLTMTAVVAEAGGPTATTGGPPPNPAPNATPTIAGAAT